MIPTRAHRHLFLTVWAGLVTILFAVWVWLDSLTHISALSWREHHVLNTYHGIVIGALAGESQPPRASRYENHPGAFAWPTEYFPLPFLVHSRERKPPTIAHSFKETRQVTIDYFGPGSWSLYIPHWLLLLPIITTWSLLLWRARRRRAANLTTLPAPPA